VSFENWPSAGVRWKGVDVLKQPVDLILQQEIIWDTKPDVLVETGSKYGGSACFYADLGVEVHSVDVAPPKTPQAHPLVTYYRGYSTNPTVLYHIGRACEGRRVMVVLDSDHSRETVLDELGLYAPLVSEGCYLVVEDTALGGPQEALAEWLPGQPFRVDTSISASVEHQGGYLIRWS
jgi:cephalosporin hydroxylase